MYTGVADKLDDQEQMDDYQREILEKALKFYERFALPQSREPRCGSRRPGPASAWAASGLELGKTDTAEQA